MSNQSKIGLVLFVVLFITYAYLPQNFRNDNIISRMALTLAILEDGSIKINKFQQATDDIAYHQGNYYTDKAPGMSFSALPIAALTKIAIRLSGNAGPTISSGKVTQNFGIITYTSTVFTCGLVTAITALAIYFLALQIGATTAGAIFAMLAFGLATPAWGWATAFFGHAMAGACLFLAFTAIVFLVNGPPNRRREILFGFLSGALLAWAVVVEFTALPAAIVIIAYGLIAIRRWERNRLVRGLLSAMVGLILFSIPVMIYNTVAFDSPFQVGYSSVPGFGGMKEGLFGITYPQLEVLYRLLFSQYRGILWYSPILIVVPFAIYMMWQGSHLRAIAIILTVIPLYYLLMNASYYYWDGGWSTGPRHLTPMLPFVCLPLAILWSRIHPIYKTILLGLFCYSLLLSLVSVSVDMMSPVYQNPLFDYIIPEFLEGNINQIPFMKRQTGLAYLIPLIILWGVGYLISRALFVRSESNI